MYKINQTKLNNARKKTSQIYMDSDVSTELNDYIFIDAICELLEIEKIIDDENILDEKKITEDFNLKINFFGFDVKTTQNLSTYLLKYFLYALSTKKIIDITVDTPITTMESTEELINKLQKPDVNFDYDIPYLGGYSEDGKTIYIDSIVNLNRNSNEILALVLHEYVEKTLFNLFKTRDNLYFRTHQIALRIEKLFVENVAGWENYDLLMKSYINKAARKTTYNMPANLDITPYRDCGYEEFYFSKNDGLKIIVTIPIFLNSFEQNYNKNRIEEIKEYCSSINNVFYNCSGKFIGFNDYISKNKNNLFGYINESKYYKRELCGIDFLVKEAFIYYGYGIGYFDITLNSIDAVDYSQVELLQLNNELVEKKENNIYENFFELLYKTEINFLETSSYLTTSFAISFFIFSNNINIDEKYLISTKICGENQSAKSIDEFKKSGLKDLYINHGFTGSVYCFDNYNNESAIVNSIIPMNNFLYLVSNVVPELNFLTQNIIKKSVDLSFSDKYDIVENHLNILKNIREKIDSFIFDIYPQNVNEYAIDASIYDKAFETWEFEKYINILKEQNKKIENLIQEFDTKLKHISDKKLNVFVKLLTGFSATSVFVDIFSHIDIKMGMYFLLIPIILLLIGVFM